MIDVKVIASGSSGNCTVLTSGSTIILLDAGIKFSTIQTALDFKNPTAVLITHEHGDHAHKSTLKEFLKRGVEVLMTHGTAEALKLEPRHNLIYCTEKATAWVGSCVVSWEKVFHDAAEPVSFAVEDGDDTVVYITDTGWLGQFDDDEVSYMRFGNEPLNVTKLLIEANFDSDALFDSNINSKLKDRIYENHLSISQVVELLSRVEMPKLKEVWLMHISKRHGDGERFRQMAQAVVPESVKVFLAI